MKSRLRGFVRWSHLWLGLVSGLFFCVMGISGAIVALRPQIAAWLSPPSPRVASCQSSVDWNRAAREVTEYAHSEINRIYGPYGNDTRYHFRMATPDPILFQHVIYDACAGQVLGMINLGWMDWTVDLHHNLLFGRTGRRWAGAIGVGMLISGLSGLLVWLLSRPNLRTAFVIRLPLSRRSPREWHRALGLIAACLLSVEAFTGLWLCFPQTMRALLPVTPEEVRPARGGRGAGGPPAGLNELMAAAHTAIPDGAVREIRLPEGNGPVQVRMWRPDDFRSLGNNVVYLAASSAQVLAVDRYADRSGVSRFVQTMAALHYDEWGGLPFRILFAIAGLTTPVLFITGFLLWWYSRPRRTTPTKAAHDEQPALTT